jgi:hypothetical protein
VFSQPFVKKSFMKPAPKKLNIRYNFLEDGTINALSSNGN